MHVGVADDRVPRAEIVLAPRAQDEPFGFDPRPLADQSLLFAERKAAEALVEARDLAAFIEKPGVPPVHAGCTLGSISRWSVSPSLPQVDRVWNLVPSVISTLIR